MIRINGRGAVYGEVWYDEELPGDSGVDIVLYRQRAALIANARYTRFLSLVTDLSVDEDAIMGKFGKEARYQIRRAETKDELSLEFIVDPETRLDEFRAFYDAFARQKSLEPSDHQWLLAACKAHQLALTSASQNGEALVWHAYVVLGNAARFQYSGSCFRNREGNYRALVGRANRWLHWRDMLQLKEMGITRYDWGGLFEDESVPEHAGINAFKKGFGGQPERTYDCTVPVTLRGQIYLPLRDAWRRWKSIPD
jgi:lipid II:glycine glycyltransferase (peptidoglycan interpeptide bridge formation enzyme)